MSPPESVVCQAPGEPPAQALPVPETNPLVSVCRQLLAVPVMVLIVSAPATVVLPFKRVVPITPSVVEGEAVPMPTRFSLALTIKVEESTIKPPERSVEVEVCPEVPTVKVEEAEMAPLTRRVSLKVDEAYTKIPAVVEVGVRTFVNKVCQAPLNPARAKSEPLKLSKVPLQLPEVSRAPQEKAPLSPMSCSQLLPEQGVPK